MDTILIVEDDKTIRATMRENLEEEGYLILEAMNGKRMMDILQRHPVDLILMDLQLPDGNGYDLIPPARQKTDAPLIIVSGSKCQNQKADCLDCGADDFITKPFDLIELHARIRANLRRFRGHFETTGHAANPSKAANQQTFGEWTLDPTTFQIYDADNNPGNLTVREFQLLETLFSNSGKPLRREELCDAIREDNYVPTPRAIDVKITRLRKKIGDNAAEPRIIKTVRGVGYMLCLE